MPTLTPWMPPRMAPLAAAALAACDPSGGPALGPGAPETDRELPPCLVKTSEFSAVPIIEINRASRRAVEVRNVRDDAACRVISVQLVENRGCCSLPDGPVGPVLIPPGAALAISLGYTWPADRYGDLGATVRIRLDAPEGPTIDIPVDVFRPYPDRPFEVVPTVLDFGDHLVGCGPKNRRVTVTNPHDVPLRLLSAQMESAEAAFFSYGAPPPSRNAEPGQTFMIDLGFLPTRTGTVTATLHLGAGPGGRTAVHLVGRALEDEVRTDRWTTPAGPPPVDILFFIDDARSMARFESALYANLRDFATYLATQGLDVRVALATSSSNGAFVPVDGTEDERIVTPEDLGRHAGVLADRLPDRFDGPSDGRLLDRVVRGLSVHDGARNPRWLRPEAILAVIALSDQADASAAPLDVFEGFLANIKGVRRPELFSFSAITGGDVGCSGPTGTAQAAVRLVELAERTGGVVASLCTQDWSRTLEGYRCCGFPKSRWRLPMRPLEGSLRITVNGVPVPRQEANGRVNWAYGAVHNAISFTPLATPPPGSTIRATYVPTCE